MPPELPQKNTSELQGSNTYFWLASHDRPFDWPQEAAQIDQGRSLCVHHKDMFEIFIRANLSGLREKTVKDRRLGSVRTDRVHPIFRTHILAASDYSFVKELRTNHGSNCRYGRRVSRFGHFLAASGRQIVSLSLPLSTALSQIFYRDVYVSPICSYRCLRGRFLNVPRLAFGPRQGSFFRSPGR